MPTSSQAMPRPTPSGTSSNISRTSRRSSKPSSNVIPQETVTDEITDMTGADCLLVVDDQEANLGLLGATLGKLGLEILPAVDAAQALRRLAVRRPDLILLDVLMPGTDGFALSRQI